MAKTEGEPVLDSDQEEIALSDSELDNVLKSAELTNEAPAGEQGNLEQYGVWVKVEPHAIEEEAEQNMSFELSDLDSSSESALTEEEEQLLGELEEEETDLGDLSGLEDDLEELGKGNAFEQQGGEEELSVEDLDVDLEELGEESLEATGDLEGLPEIGGEETLSLEMEPETEIEVPLSDSAIVDEHYEDLATVEGVPSTPGQAPPKGSSDILEKIERDLNQIKTEIQNLKNELAGLGKAGPAGGKVDVAPAPSGAEGFFEKGEDETIALTGDELDNILNTADVTEEVEIPEQIVETPEEVQPPAEGQEEIMELGSLDLEAEEAPAEELTLEDTELSLEELEPSGAEEQSIEIDIGGKSPEEQPSVAEALPAEDLATLEEGEEELILEELDGLEEIEAPEELSMEEIPEAPSTEEPIEELEELSLEESGLEEMESPEELSLEQMPEAEQAEELSLEEPAEAVDLEELDELSLEEIPEAEEAESAEEDILALDDLAEGAATADTTEDLQLAPEQLSIPEVETEGSLPVSEEMTDNLKTEMKSILSYLDLLLEDLPETKIKEFAQSEYFVRYQRLLKELGLGA